MTALAESGIPAVVCSVLSLLNFTPAVTTPVLLIDATFCEAICPSGVVQKLIRVPLAESVKFSSATNSTLAPPEPQVVVP